MRILNITTASNVLVGLITLCYYQQNGCLSYIVCTRRFVLALFLHFQISPLRIKRTVTNNIEDKNKRKVDRKLSSKYHTIFYLFKQVIMSLGIHFPHRWSHRLYLRPNFYYYLQSISNIYILEQN